MTTRHEVHRGTTADGVPWVITLHPDGTASGYLPRWHGQATSAAPMTHGMARLLIAGLPKAQALEGEVETLANSARRAFPMPRVVSAAVARMRAKIEGRKAANG